jgi:hypothetical protein
MQILHPKSGFRMTDGVQIIGRLRTNPKPFSDDWPIICNQIERREFASHSTSYGASPGGKN